MLMVHRLRYVLLNLSHWLVWILGRHLHSLRQRPGLMLQSLGALLLGWEEDKDCRHRFSSLRAIVAMQAMEAMTAGLEEKKNTPCHSLRAR